MTAGANRAKGANGPEEWRPPNTAFWCDYATVWIEVKQRWGLTATRAEATALTDMLATCGASVVTTTATPVAIPTQTVTPRQDGGRWPDGDASIETISVVRRGGCCRRRAGEGI